MVVVVQYFKVFIMYFNKINQIYFIFYCNFIIVILL